MSQQQIVTQTHTAHVAFLPSPPAIIASRRPGADNRWCELVVKVKLRTEQVIWVIGPCNNLIKKQGDVHKGPGHYRTWLATLEVFITLARSLISSLIWDSAWVLTLWARWLERGRINTRP